MFSRSTLLGRVWPISTAGQRLLIQATASAHATGQNDNDEVTFRIAQVARGLMGRQTQKTALRIAGQVFHTFVAALLPLVVLVLRNVPATPLTSTTILRPTVAILAGTVGLLVGLRPVLPDLSRRAVMLTVWFFLLPFYPPVARSLGYLSELTGSVWFALAYALAAAAAAIAAGGRFADKEAVLTLNATARALSLAIAIYCTWLARPLWPPKWTDAVQKTRDTAAAQSVRSPLRRAPDVYYVVLDGMLRPDLISAIHHVDSEGFSTGLRHRGFAVGGRTHSNYGQTLLSLASSLNMSYLDEVAGVMGSASDRRPLATLIQTAGVVRRFKQLGYEFVMIGSDAPGTVNHQEADRCYCGLVKGLSEFETALLASTPAAPFRLVNLTFGAHRTKVEESFAAIEQVSRLRGPMFVFAHVLVPHPPFVFNGDGSFRAQRAPFVFRDGSEFLGDRSDYTAGYAQQVAFVMKRILKMIDEIDRHGGEPVLVIQGDHGSGLRLDWDDPTRSDATERLGILAAVRLPGNRAVPDDLTPVNLFRVVFNELFGDRYTLLPNRSYLSEWDRPYRFVEMHPE